MAEKKSVGHAYNVDFLNVVFAASSIFLFVCVVWMVWDDFDREWKNTQRRFTQLEMEVPRAQPAPGQRGGDAEKRGEPDQQLAGGPKKGGANGEKGEEVQSQIEAL